MNDIRQHMQDQHNTPYPIAQALSEEQLIEWDNELHANQSEE